MTHISIKSVVGYLSWWSASTEQNSLLHVSMCALWEDTLVYFSKSINKSSESVILDYSWVEEPKFRTSSMGGLSIGSFDGFLMTRMVIRTTGEMWKSLTLLVGALEFRGFKFTEAVIFRKCTTHILLYIYEFPWHIHSSMATTHQSWLNVEPIWNENKRHWQ